MGVTPPWAFLHFFNMTLKPPLTRDTINTLADTAANKLRCKPINILDGSKTPASVHGRQFVCAYAYAYLADATLQGIGNFLGDEHGPKRHTLILACIERHRAKARIDMEYLGLWIDYKERADVALANKYAPVR